ncbi:hypothetical protein QUF63_09625 [Anaerolineales bacterium HSG25]|nr:hypothetical protein [Anaerolineales bacterium HSG25]
MLEQLNQAITAQQWGACAETCFQILYGLPVELQQNLAIMMIRRYLPVFEATCPTVIWPRQILHDPGQWQAVHGRTFPDTSNSEKADMATAAFRSCFSGLLLTYSYPNNPFTVTSACCYAINEAINAQQIQRWQTDDPTAYQHWTQNDFSLWPERAMHNNQAVIAVRSQAWQVVTAWFHEQTVWQYPAPTEIDVPSLEQALSDWRRNHMLITVPAP